METGGIAIRFRVWLYMFKQLQANSNIDKQNNKQKGANLNTFRQYLNNRINQRLTPSKSEQKPFTSQEHTNN